ncbi:hypothetical protein PAAG_02121 [Paracoccidioides lutzii Pb01]|uniref:Secreted protein n=1 Tax=Paracoccidioides lutzii (strain ATCC MYA-826 / Pb01) TaxID=502779 RepID=C1GUC6_PARBA|nr:hypothetical protein PAAG_02121 [Paracoccidioides lutzii Pb01]EEH39932.2 hypothetical protein PAAG_02121 [Paracoccidioides lutzii Pb01]
MNSLVPKTCLLILSSIRQVLGAGHGGGPLPRHPQGPPGGSIVARSVIATNHHVCCAWSRLVDKGSRLSTIQGDSRKPSDPGVLGPVARTPHGGCASREAEQSPQNAGGIGAYPPNGGGRRRKRIRVNEHRIKC